MAEELARYAGPDGFVPFDRFMEVTLYQRGSGYYDRVDSPIGAAGDFYTAPQLHPIFGVTLGGYVARLLTELARQPALKVVELGPGNGELASAVIQEVLRAGPEEMEVDYVLVERATRRTEGALRRVTAASKGSRVRVRRTTSLGEVGPFAGVVLAHEFLDAQPARRLCYASGAWQELGVRANGDRWEHAIRPLSGRSPVEGLPTDIEDGSVVEIAPQAEGCLRELGDHLLAGRAILVDYGASESELIHGHRLGTLTAVRAHQVLESPLDRPGSADLSTFVNFSRIRRAAERSGLALLADRSQAEALGAWGIAEAKERLAVAASPQEKVQLHLAVKNLLFGFAQFRALEFAPKAAAVT